MCHACPNDLLYLQYTYTGPTQTGHTDGLTDNLHTQV